MRNLFVKTALVLCTTIIFLPATVFATEPQNTEITSAEEGFTDSDPSVSYENDNSLTLDEKEDDSTSTEPPAEDEKTPDKADTDKENPDPDIFTSGDDFGDGSKSNPFHVVIDSDNPEDGDAPQITDPVIDNGGYSGGGGGGNSTSDSSSEKILHKPQVLLEDSTGSCRCFRIFIIQRKSNDSLARITVFCYSNHLFQSNCFTRSQDLYIKRVFLKFDSFVLCRKRNF